MRIVEPNLGFKKKRPLKNLNPKDTVYKVYRRVAEKDWRWMKGTKSQ